MKNKGITLIALVITIVVLIILASVAITLSLGNNGLLNRAKSAKEVSINSQIEESTTLADYEGKIDEYVDGTRTVPSNYTLLGTITTDGGSLQYDLTNYNGLFVVLGINHGATTYTIPKQVIIDTKDEQSTEIEYGLSYMFWSAYSPIVYYMTQYTIKSNEMIHYRNSVSNSSFNYLKVYGYK